MSLKIIIAWDAIINPAAALHRVCYKLELFRKTMFTTILSLTNCVPGASHD